MTQDGAHRRRRRGFGRVMKENRLMARVYNFSAGPAVLPEEVLRQAAAEMLDYDGTGMSVMEMSHRSKPFASIIETAEADLRELLQIPDNYQVLFLQGGATQQFAAVPMNLMQNKKADYIVSGSWSKKAWKEAKLFGEARCVASSEDENFSYVPDVAGLEFDPEADYVYICQNETIYGTTYHTLPEIGDIPLVTDVSSMFLSEPMDVSKYGLIYGGVQKNVGPAGVVIVIVRDDLIREDVLPFTPTIMRYKTQADAGSLSNTPPAYGIYVCGLVFKWLKEQGGLEAIQKRNQEKAALLYDEIDRNPLFVGTATEEDRSLMNICFVMAEGYEELAPEFLEFAKSQGMVGIKGHRLVGGFRASCYNALPKESVEALVACMQEFARKHGK